MTNKPGKKLALTGATGFVGKQLLADCLAAGHAVTALARTSQPDQPGVQWVLGDLDDDEALKTLVGDADVVFHLAGLTKALDRSEFDRVNADRTAKLAEICRDHEVPHFVFLSSLAATRPSVSPYAASKAKAEKMLAQFDELAMRITPIRAPVVLGPGDSATRPLFAGLVKGVIAVPAGKAGQFRFSIIDVRDLSQLMLSLVDETKEPQGLIAPYGQQYVQWRNIADSAGVVLNRRIKEIGVPSPVLAFVARATDIAARLTRKPNVFSRDKIVEMNAGEWIADHPVDNPYSLEETLRRCLTPFSKSLTSSPKTFPQEF